MAVKVAQGPAVSLRRRSLASLPASLRARFDPDRRRAFGPAALTAFLGFRAGGFFADIVGLCALALIVALILRITLVARPTAGWSIGLAVAAAGLGALGAWTVASIAWSHAPARGLLVLDGVLLYGLVLVL